MAVIQEGTSAKGIPYVIRGVETEDAEGAHAYINRLSKERTFVRLQGEEIALEDERKIVAKWVAKGAEGASVHLVLVAEGGIRGISSIELEGKTENHVGTFALSVDQSVRGQGLGELLMRATIEEAKKRLRGLRTVALKVKGPNAAARALYAKLGFKEYGTLPRGTMHQGELVDEISMYLEL
jgi:RimJ/RimL family protein N-acetyltransferase